MNTPTQRLRPASGSHAREPLVRVALVLLAALTLAPGFPALQRHRPVVIRAQDIETKKPLAGAEVRISPAIGSAHVSTGTTGNDGIVRLRATPVTDEPIAVEANMAGYLTETTYIPLRIVRTLEPPHLFDHEETRPVSFVVEMYPKPLPMIELILPPGYRGEVRADVVISPKVAWPAGQRKFGYPVSAQGTVEVAGPEFLRRVNASSFVLKFADGAPLSLAAETTDIGYWWLRHDGDSDFYFIGTRADYTLKKSHDQGQEIIERTSSSSGGRGRGRRRGPS
jgi:hypothetical protein